MTQTAEERRVVQAAYYQRNRDSIREKAYWQRLLSRYGVTREDYERMLEAQNGVCAICKDTCKTGERLCVDHDHETGQVRGLLCKSCNFHVGVLERADWRTAAEEYLADWIRNQ